MKNRSVLVLGGTITDYAKAKASIDDEDCVIFCDRGLRHLEALGVKPSLAVGSVRMKVVEEVEIAHFVVESSAEGPEDEKGGVSPSEAFPESAESISVILPGWKDYSLHTLRSGNGIEIADGERGLYSESLQVSETAVAEDDTVLVID